MHSPNLILTLTKAEATKRQIRAAIDHFEAGDFDIAITLAGAAEGMIVEPPGGFLFRTVEKDQRALERFGKKAWIAQLNRHRDWLKHASGGDIAMDFDRDTAAIMIARAVHKLQAAGAFEDARMEEFRRWLDDNLGEIERRVASELDQLAGGSAEDGRSPTVAELFDAIGQQPHGSVAWGCPVPCRDSGVYVISLDGPADLASDPRFEGHREHWLEGQAVAYIGRSKHLRRRLREFCRHVYGRPRPHRGGEAILLLSGPKTVTWLATKDYAGAEDRLIKTFEKAVGRRPFGNRARSARIHSLGADRVSDDQPERTLP